MPPRRVGGQPLHPIYAPCAAGRAKGTTPMAKVYVVHQDGSTESLPGVRCVDEDKELQRVLEKNPDLIPGEQINPDDPRRWLIIKREMPVPDPNSGSDRWSILLADQDAMPTFVECK